MKDENAKPSYTVQGERVPLERSRRFMAVKAAPEGEEALAALALRLAPAPAQSAMIDLPEQGICVVELAASDAASAAGAEPAPFEALTEAIEAEPELTPGPAVYESPDDPDTALIAVGELIVKYRGDSSERTRERLRSKFKVEPKHADYPEPDAELVTVAAGRDPLEIANELVEEEAVEYAEPSFVVLGKRPVAPNGDTALAERLALTAQLSSAATVQPGVTSEPLPEMPSAPPSDPGFGSQWGLAKIRAPEAWEITAGSSGISVAIIDEGCDMVHEDVAYVAGHDAYDGDSDPSPAFPQDAHGTACAGVAAASAGNAKGGAGVAPGCRIVPIRIAQGIPGSPYWSTDSGKVASGIRNAVDLGADVLSNSYRVGPSNAVLSAFRYAQTNGRGGKGSLIAAAAGNGDVRGLIYPARLSPAIPGFLAVGASNEWDQRKSKTSLDGESWWGSNWGPELDCVAPGVHVYTTDITGTAGYGSGNYVPNFNGTSSATPHAAGVAALVISVDPELRSWEVEEIIKLSAKELGVAGRDEEYGHGRVDARAALEAASKIWYAIHVEPVFLGSGRECYMRATIRMYNPGINRVRLDSLTLSSRTRDWTHEIDRFEYRPNPGNLLEPRSNHDIRLNGILLRAIGTSSSWSYRWHLGWSYTFWRPAGPGLPLEGNDPGEGRSTTSWGVRGESNSAVAELECAPGETSTAHDLTNGAIPGERFDQDGDFVAVDRRSRAITIVVR